MLFSGCCAVRVVPVHRRGEVERQARPERVEGEPPVREVLAVAHGGDHRERQLLDGGASGFASVVAGYRDRVESRQATGSELHGVAGQPHRRTGREDEGLPREELLQDVVLKRARQGIEGDGLPLRRDKVHREDDGRRRVDREVHRETVKREPIEQLHHVFGRIDGDADATDLRARHRIRRVVAQLRGQIEGDRQRRLPLLQQEAVASIRVLR